MLKIVYYNFEIHSQTHSLLLPTLHTFSQTLHTHTKKWFISGTLAHTSIPTQTNTKHTINQHGQKGVTRKNKNCVFIRRRRQDYYDVY